MATRRDQPTKTVAGAALRGFTASYSSWASSSQNALWRVTCGAAEVTIADVTPISRESRRPRLTFISERDRRLDQGVSLQAVVRPAMCIDALLARRLACTSSTTCLGGHFTVGYVRDRSRLRTRSARARPRNVWQWLVSPPFPPSDSGPSRMRNRPRWRLALFARCSSAVPLPNVFAVIPQWSRQPGGSRHVIPDAGDTGEGGVAIGRRCLGLSAVRRSNRSIERCWEARSGSVSQFAWHCAGAAVLPVEWCRRV
jgi:hypothetical protein